jgi:hypothetical protein
MSIAFGQQIPESLIQELFESDRLSCGTPKLPPEKREVAIKWLRRVLVDFEALDKHIAFLQKLYRSSFQYPRPRRDQWDVEQPLDPPTNSEFTHVDRISDDRLATILDEGVDDLSDEEIGALLLNPYALFDLFDVIDDVQPEYWLDAIHDLVAARPRARRTWPPYVDTKPRPEHTRTRHLPAVGIDDASTELRSNLDPALARKQLSEVLVREAPLQGSRGLQYAMALTAIGASCAACVMAFWAAIYTQQANRPTSAQIAASTEERNTAMVPYASHGEALTLERLHALHILDQPPERALQTLEKTGTPELRALITVWRSENTNLDAATIIQRLRALVEKVHEGPSQ